MKTGQIATHAFASFIVTILMGFALLFGYKAIDSIREGTFRTQLTVVEVDLRDSMRVMVGDLGTREELSYKIPCGADHALVVDLNKRDEVRATFAEFPFIREAMESGASDNLFIVKESQVIASFDIGWTDISYPY